MAAEGLRFTDFYSAAEVCTPSRAALLTGRYPIRSGMCGDRRVLFPNSAGGLPPAEVTIAEALKPHGYATAHIGKWHLGIHAGGRPLDQGFDHSFGLPYSNDMDGRPGLPRGASGLPDPPHDGWNVALLRDGQVVEQPADQTTLTRRYTEDAVQFIREKKDGPFFLYFPHTFPHVPLFASPAFKGKSRAGIYGDAVEELDWSVGQVLDTLTKEGIAERTLVFFTSDNGPWLIMGDQGGSAGLLREGKGSTWEGGMRVPGIAWMPGRIRPGVTSELAHAMDLFPTSLALAGVPLPTGVTLDGVDLAPLLFERKSLPPRPFFYYRGDQLFACRLGRVEGALQDADRLRPAEARDARTAAAVPPGPRPVRETRRGRRAPGSHCPDPGSRPGPSVRSRSRRTATQIAEARKTAPEPMKTCLHLLCLVLRVAHLRPAAFGVGCRAASEHPVPVRRRLGPVCPHPGRGRRPGGINDVVRTPNFDRIARSGVLFRNAHVNAPSCTPCRSALLSGQYFWARGAEPSCKVRFGTRRSRRIRCC